MPGILMYNLILKPDRFSGVPVPAGDDLCAWGRIERVNAAAVLVSSAISEGKDFVVIIRIIPPFACVHGKARGVVSMLTA